MTDLRWSWLGAPYFVLSATIFAGALAAAFVRGDRVLRLGMLGAAATALPWALCQGFAACTDDPLVATRLLRVGQGPVALVGPMLLLLLLGVSGQLERQKWLARLAGVIGIVFLVLCWTTDWTVPGVQRLSSGMFYTAVGPLTGVHISLLVVWLAIGLWIVRRSSPTGERRRSTRLVMGVLVFAAIGSLDTFLLYGIWGSYPIAWLPAQIAASIALYTALRSDLLRPQGFDREAGLEVGAFALALVVTSLFAMSSVGRSPVALAAVASLVWTAATAGAWAIGRARPVRVAGERELDQFVARVAALDSETKIAELLAGLWQRAAGVAPRAMWWRDPARDGALVRVGGRQEWPLAPEVVSWLVAHGAPIAISDFATMRLGAMRPQLEGLGIAHAAALVVPLVDREDLVGLVEADYNKALREGERGLIGESARAAARALTFVQLARAASRERETAREVEIADALRLQASTSRDAELDHWSVAAEYRSAPRTTVAGWCAIELADGRLALLVTEAQAHGVAAALATAALTGGFSAAATSASTLDDIVTALRASADGVTRGGEPVAAFLAILDANARSIDWACAGHPGALVVGPIAVVEAGLPEGSIKSQRVNVTLVGTGTRAPDASMAAATRGTALLPDDSLVVIASTALRGDDDERWQRMVRDRAPAAARLATVLVETALAAGTPAEDLLAVVVRTR